MPRVRRLHAWNVSPSEAREIQRRLRPRVRQCNGSELKDIRYVAGVDVSVKGDRAVAAVLVLNYDDLEIVEVAVVEQPVPFPYVPGLLSFREIPCILAAVERLAREPQVFLVDGQGFAHPRRLGLASHLGVLLDKPTIGCAKTRLIGSHDEPWHECGYYADLIDATTEGDELIGAVFRSRTNVKPLYISVGHKIDLPTALDVVWACCAGYRLPEPTRLAHQAAGGTLRWGTSDQATPASRGEPRATSYTN